MPGWLAGPFGSTGLDLGVGGLIGVLALMFVSYVIAVAPPASLSARTVLMAIAALHALVLLAPPLVSTDIFSYQAYARMGGAVRRQPLPPGPHAIALDRVYPVHRRQVVLHPQRLRTGVHRLQLLAGAADDRRQRARLQVDRRAGQPGDGGAGVERAPGCAAWTRSRRWRWWA